MHILFLDSLLSFIERHYTPTHIYPQQTFKVQLSPTANATQTASYITHTCCKSTGIRRRSSTSGSMTGTSTSETITRYIFMDTRAVSTISLLFTPYLTLLMFNMTIQVNYSYLHLYLCYYYCITFHLLICLCGPVYFKLEHL